MRIVALVALAACSPRPAAVWPDVEACRSPEGEPWMAALTPGEADLHGFRRVVESIGEDAYSVSVRGASVRRTLGDGGPECPPRPDPDDPCESIAFMDFHDDLWMRLQDAGLQRVSIYADGLRVHDYAELDAAALAVADALRAGRIRAPFALQVVPPGCASILETGR